MIIYDYYYIFILIFTRGGHHSHCVMSTLPGVQFLGATRNIARISYGNVSVWLAGCLSQPVLYQNLS